MLGGFGKLKGKYFHDWKAKFFTQILCGVADTRVFVTGHARKCTAWLALEFFSLISFVLLMYIR